MQLTTLASGSKGNASFIQENETAVLVDCGISCKKMVENLDLIGIRPEQLNGIFITHEHRDHIAGLKVFSKKFQIPIFSTAETLDAILQTKGFEDMDKRLLNVIRPDTPFKFGDLLTEAFEIPHDAARPVGYSFQNGDKKVAVCTDIGMITDSIIEHLSGSDAMVLESNHDVRMLEAGRYPYNLKRRILSDSGHLSNENAGRLLTKLWSEKLKHIFLGHLSEENNLPELALETVKLELSEKVKQYETFTKISVALKDLPSETVPV